MIRPKTAKALVFRLGGRLVRAGKVTVPARPYLSFGRADDAMAEEAIKEFFRRVMARGWFKKAIIVTLTLIPVIAPARAGKVKVPRRRRSVGPAPARR